MVLTASLNDSPPMPAIVDISASHTVVNRHAARIAGIENGDGTDLYCHSPMYIRLGKEPSSPSSAGHDNIIAETSREFYSDVPLAVDNGTHNKCLAWPGPRQTVEALIEGPVPVRELPSLAPLGLADDPVMILGMDILCRCSHCYIKEHVLV